MTETKYADEDYHAIGVAVLGASGFIGRWVARALCARGADVTLVVRDRTAAQEIFSKYEINGQICVVDLQDHEQVRKLFRKIRPSITFNLAGYGVDPSERDEAIAFAINAHLLTTICTAIAEVRDRHWPGQDLVHIGSALEYGTIGGNLSEDSRPNPTTLYGKSKLAGTCNLSRNCANYEMKALTARLFTVYGPGEHEGRLFPSLLKSARTGDPLALTSGRQKRDFVYVEDVAEGILRLGLATARPGEIVNVATGHSIPVRTFAETAAGILQIPYNSLDFGAVPMRAAEMTHSDVTLERLWQLTTWIPSAGIAEGIRNTVNFESSHKALIEGERMSTQVKSEPDLSLIIPCYNEAEVIRNTVVLLAESFRGKGIDVELILVDNGSGDDTGKIIDELIAAGQPVVKETVPVNRGYGHGILCGLRACRGKLVGFTCADAQVQAQDVVKVYQIATQATTPKLVKVRRRFRMDGLIRNLASVIYNLSAAAIFGGLGSIDINGNPKILPREYLQGMNLESKDWFLDAEIMIKAKQLGLGVIEFNVMAQMREGGSSHVSLSTCWEFAVNLFKYRLGAVGKLGSPHPHPSTGKSL